MKVIIIKHIDFEGPGYIYDYLIEMGCEVKIKLVSNDFRFPEQEEFDFLILLGGPMGAYEEDKFPWLVQERKFIKETFQAGKKIFGVCLGCQILASVFEAKVYPGPYKEFGWYPVNLTKEASQSKFTNNLPQTFSPLHWHGDTFDLPKGAKLLASSVAYPNQMIEFSANVLGIQFHLEFREQDLVDFNELGELKNLSGPWVQEAKEVCTNFKNFSQAQKLLKSILNAFLSTSSGISNSS